MKVRVNDIKDKVHDLSTVEEVAAYPTLTRLQESGECLFLEPLDVRLTVAREYDHIRVKGSVATRVRLICSRCLTEYDEEISSSYTMFYIPASDAPMDEDVELEEQDLVSVSYSGEEIDFSDEIAEQVLMEIPYKPLCMEDCRGLCPVCGADLNNAACDCGRSDGSLKFSILKNFEVKK